MKRANSIHFPGEAETRIPKNRTSFYFDRELKERAKRVKKIIEREEKRDQEFQAELFVD